MRAGALLLLYLIYLQIKGLDYSQQLSDGHGQPNLGQFPCFYFRSGAGLLGKDMQTFGEKSIANKALVRHWITLQLDGSEESRGRFYTCLFPYQG